MGLGSKFRRIEQVDFYSKVDHIVYLAIKGDDFLFAGIVVHGSSCEAKQPTRIESYFGEIRNDLPLPLQKELGTRLLEQLNQRGKPFDIVFLDQNVALTLCQFPLGKDEIVLSAMAIDRVDANSSVEVIFKLTPEPFGFAYDPIQIHNPIQAGDSLHKRFTSALPEHEAPGTDRHVFYVDHIEAHFGSSRDRPSLSSEEELLYKRKGWTCGPEFVWDEKSQRRQPQPHVLTDPRCLYCRGPLRFFGQPDNEPFVGAQSFVGECTECGWWFCESMDYTHPDHEFSAHDYYEGILRRFDIHRLDLPLGLLRRHLLFKFGDVRHLHPRKFEELCADMFGEHFDCNVRLTSYSRDGGIDLYLIDCDSPCVVQLKRRAADVTEGVQAVRAFLGAMVQHGETRGLFASTARDFSPDAKRAAGSQNVIELGLRLDLMNYDGLQQLFHRRAATRKPWKEIAGVRVPTLTLHGRRMPPRFPW